MGQSMSISPLITKTILFYSSDPQENEYFSGKLRAHGYSVIGVGKVCSIEDFLCFNKISLLIFFDTNSLNKPYEYLIEELTQRFPDLPYLIFPEILTSKMFSNDIDPKQTPKEPILNLILESINEKLQGSPENNFNFPESFYSTLFYSSNEAMLLLNETTIFDCNNATLVLFGCTDKSTLYNFHPPRLSSLIYLPNQPSEDFLNQQLSLALSNGAHRFECTCKRLDDDNRFEAEIYLSRIIVSEKSFLQATIRNISERKHTERELFLRYSIEQITSRISVWLLNYTDFDATIYDILGELGTFTGADRTYIYQFSGQPSEYIENLYEWCSTTINSLSDIVKSFQSTEFPYPLSKLKKNEVVFIKGMAGFIEDENFKRDFFCNNGIQQLLLFPLYVKNTFFGFAGFDNPKLLLELPGSVYEFLHILSQIISGSFERRKVEIDLQASNRQLVASEQQLRAINFQLSSSEDHLRIAQSKLARAMDVGKLALWSMFVSSGTLEIDERKALMLGYKPVEFKNKRFSDLLGYIHEEDREIVEKSLDQHLKGISHSYNVEYRILRADGTYSWFNDRGEISFRKLNGAPVQITGISIDISTQKQAKELLEETEKRLSGIVNTIDDVVWSIDMSSDMKIIYLSPAIKKVFGREFVEFKENKNLWIQCIHPDDKSTMADSFLQLKSAGTFDSERRIIHPDGSIRWVRDRGYNIYDVAGNVIRVDGIISDITKRKMVEESLRESEVLFRAIVENSHNAICILNEHGKITWINNRMIEISHYSREQLLNADSFISFIASESIDFVKRNFYNHLKGLPFEPVYCFQFLRPDGEKRTVEKHTVGFTDKYGKRNLIIHMLDITELKQAEESLKESESRWRSYVEHAPYGVIITDKKGTFLQVNPQACKITGFTIDTFVKLRFSDLLPDDLRKEELLFFNTLIKNGEYHGEMRFFHNSGEKRWWTIAAVCITENMYVVFVSDITNRKIAEEEHLRLEAQLRHSQKMDSIGELAAGIAHEINNPVGFVLGNSETIIEYVNALKTYISLYEKNSSPEELLQQRDTLDIDYIMKDIDSLLGDNLSGLNRVKEIVSNLKDFARLDTAQFTETDIEDNLRKTLAIAKSELKYEIDVHTIFGSVSHVYCNPGEMNQVFLNLVINAAQAIKEQKRSNKGNITIATSEDDYSVYCDISDDGPGIPLEIQTRIFEPFFTTKDVGKGTGLGLSIAYDIIVNKHNGTLNVKSEPGNGASFRIQLPKRKDK
jgi:PAS domain S-box-containing protein